MKTTYKTLALALIACTSLSACGAVDRISQIGQAPEVGKIVNPTTQDNYQPVSLPMPTPKNIDRPQNSLWAADRVTFFKDQRAKDIGDIITVMIDIQDEAEIENETSRSRSSAEGSSLNNFLGYGNALDRLLPEDVTDAAGALTNPDIVDINGSSSHSGSGTTEREEAVDMKLAALITQILPNGNMVIHGKQEVLVNFEKRVLKIDGVIRPEDITVNNTISYEQIAEARIVYGGEGQITDMQQPRYGQQLYDIIFPF